MSRFEGPRASRDDNSFLHTRSVVPLPEGRPEVGVDGGAGGVGAVEPDVEVGLVVPCLVLDTVGRKLRKYFKGENILEMKIFS